MMIGIVEVGGFRNKVKINKSSTVKVKIRPFFFHLRRLLWRGLWAIVLGRLFFVNIKKPAISR